MYLKLLINPYKANAFKQLKLKIAIVDCGFYPDLPETRTIQVEKYQPEKYQPIVNKAVNDRLIYLRGIGSPSWTHIELTA